MREIPFRRNLALAAYCSLARQSLASMAAALLTGETLDQVPGAGNGTSVAYGILAKNPIAPYSEGMAVTLNISVSEDQAAWIKARKERGDFASASDVIRDLIRRQRDQESAALEKEFEVMDKRDGAPGPAPVGEIVSACRQVRRDLLKKRHGHETRRGS